MHPVNKLLRNFGLGLTSATKIPREFKVNYKRLFKETQKNKQGFDVFEEMCYDAGVHPVEQVDFELTFASRHLSELNPSSILDIGSQRHWIIGLLAQYQVTTVDVRDRTSELKNEKAVTCDAKQLKLPDASFEVVTSICALEHFGLGRYGDDFDLDGDRKAINEMIRVLKSGGHLIFSTTITRARPSIAFNGHRIYSHQMIKDLCADLICVEERFFNKKMGRFCSLEEVGIAPKHWDVYCGCWKKR
jgi:SAM-dependent methyltransferase